MKKARRAGCSLGRTVLAAQSAESFDLDEVGVLRQLLYRLGRRQVDAQDAFREKKYKKTGILLHILT